MSDFRASAPTVEFVSIVINEMSFAKAVFVNGKEVQVPRAGIVAEALFTTAAAVVGAVVGILLVGIGVDLATARKVKGRWVAILKDDGVIQGDVERTSLTGALFIRGEWHRPSPNMIWLEDGRIMHARLDGYVLGLVQAAIESKAQTEELAASAQAAMDQADAEAQAAHAKAEAAEAAKAKAEELRNQLEAAQSRAQARFQDLKEEVEAAKAKALKAEAEALATAKALKAEAEAAEARAQARFQDIKAKAEAAEAAKARAEAEAAQAKAELETYKAPATPAPAPEVAARHLAEEGFVAACTAAMALSTPLPPEFERLMGALLLLSSARDENAPAEAFAALNHTRGLALGEVRAHGPSGIPEVDEAFRQMEAAAKAARAARKAVA